MLSALWTGLKVVLGVLNVFGWISRWLDRRRAREDGRQDQRLDSLEAQKEQAADANRIDEDVRRMSDDDLYRELHGRPPDKG